MGSGGQGGSAGQAGSGGAAGSAAGGSIVAGSGGSTGGTCGTANEWALWPVPPEKPVDYSTTPDTATDSVTGLVWQRVPPTTTYSRADAVAYCETLDLGGRTDWRLPTRIELLSILDSTSTKPAINSTVFTGTPTSGLGSMFWTSTPDAVYGAGFGWMVDFRYGQTNGGATATTTYGVRCVAGQGTAPASRYVVDTDTVRDTKTGLTWQRGSSAGSLEIGLAPTHCSSLSLGGLSTGWRLPTKKELETLVDVCTGTTDPVFQATAIGDYWTSSSYTDTYGTHLWAVEFRHGYTETRDGSCAVRCVHSP